MARAKTKRKKPQTPSGAMSIKEAVAKTHGLIEEGEWLRADKLARQLFAAAPNNPDVLAVCALLAEQGGHLQSALDLFAQSLKKRPRDIHALTESGRILHQLGRYQEAFGALQQALSFAPTAATPHLYLGNILSSMGQLPPAEHHYRAAIAADDHSAAAHRNLARALVPMGRAAEAVEHAQKAIDLEPENAAGHSRLANALDRLGRLEPALKAHEKAIELDPDDPQTRLQYAQSLAGYGKMEEARAQCKHVISQYPDYAPAHALLAGFTRFRARNDELTALEKLAANDTLSVHERSSIQFALGKALEDLGDPEAAFTHFEAANRMVRQRAQYSQAQTAQFFDDLKQAFSAPAMEALGPGGDPDPTPIFVLGMPRSGTSLVEQILSSHTDVAGAGELALMANAARQILTLHPTASQDLPTQDAALLSQDTLLSEALPHLTPAQRQSLGQTYLTQLRPYAPKASRIIDKLPANFLYIGLIHLILPNAKIVHCRRNPLDNALSIYKTHFTEGALAWSYDMADLGAYFRRYDDLMVHWQGLFGDKIFTVQYEELVADQEAGSRALLAHCGLDWQPQVLQFHKTDKPVHTASIAQVRQPIYQTSVGAAARYGEKLNPLIAALGPGLSGQA